MKIVCESCGAVYAIDDSLIPSRGARAQCPRCGKQQRVIPAAAPAPGAAQATVPAPSVAPPRPPPPPRDGADPLPPPPPPVAPLIPRTPAAAPAPAPGPSRCQVCGTTLTDPFDQALGVCDSCRQRRTTPGYPPPAPEPAPATAAPAPVVAPAAPKAPGGEPDFDAIFAEAAAQAAAQAATQAAPPPSRPGDVLSMFDAASPPEPLIVEPGPQPNPRSAAGSSSGRFNAAGPSSGRQAAVGPSSGRFNAARPQPRRRWILPVAIAAILLLGGGAFLLRPRLEAMRHPEAKEVAPSPNEIARSIASRWRLSLEDVSRTAGEYLAQGNARLVEDTSAAYPEAEEAFQKALVLDPSSDDAATGYVLAAALGRGTQLGNAPYQEALELIEAVERRAKGKPRVLLAHANLLLTRSDSREAVLQARELAQQALAATRPQEQSEAQAAIGLTYLDTSAQLAAQRFDEALKADPPLKRAYYYRGLAYEITGEYRKAIQDLKTRLAQDPDQGDVVAALARLYEEVGEIEEARAIHRKIHEQHPDDLRSAVSLAALAYRAEGKPREAVASLRALLAEPGTSPQEAQAEGWVHLATAERLLGNLDAATAAAQQALKQPGAGRAAHLQLFLLALQRGRPEQAAPHLEFLGGRGLSPALVKLLEGRLLFAQGKVSEAQAAFDASFQLEPRRLDARIYSAVAAARAGKKDEAIRGIVQAMQEDPWRLGPLASPPYYLQREDTLAGAEGYFLKLAHDPGDVMPMIAEAFIRFHQHDLAAADKLLRQALEVNGNVMASAYRTMVALERNEKQAALSLATQAVEQGRQQALAHYALGLALAADGQGEPAMRELRSAASLAPTLLSAEVHLAQLEARANTPGALDSARSRLMRVVGLDPAYLPAKRALYALEQ